MLHSDANSQATDMRHDTISYGFSPDCLGTSLAADPEERETIWWLVATCTNASLYQHVGLFCCNRLLIKKKSSTRKAPQEFLFRSHWFTCETFFLKRLPPTLRQSVSSLNLMTEAYPNYFLLKLWVASAELRAVCERSWPCHKPPICAFFSRAGGEWKQRAALS